jgi:hypothetical protein
MADQCKASFETPACLVIDDPLLKPQYGFLDYNKLLREMKEHRFFSEIAFIPWNRFRSSPEVVRLFADNRDYFSLCVHGCFHTRGEFCGNDYNRLCLLASTALSFMNDHQLATGLGFDPVMVFPQRRFSSTAMSALRNFGYKAVVNPTLKTADGILWDSDGYDGPASKVDGEIPFFLRRFPKKSDAFLNDIARGRPIILGAHHVDFKNGYQWLTDFVDWVNSQGNIRWQSLNDIVDYYYGASKFSFENGSRELALGNWKITARRHASEIRDEFIETNSVLDWLYRKVRKMIEHK